MKAAAADYVALLEEFTNEGNAITLRVRGSSMLPAIPDGAVVRLQPLSEMPRVGEVIALRDPSGRMLCHRVVRVYRQEEQTWIQTWGDVSREPDAAVPVSSVIGSVVAIVEDESGRAIATRPGWHIRARYLKRALRRLLSH
ncbi:MAG: S24/S26 family peptidase [Bacteroidota bacterium]